MALCQTRYLGHAKHVIPMSVIALYLGDEMFVDSQLLEAAEIYINDLQHVMMRTPLIDTYEKPA